MLFVIKYNVLHQILTMKIGQAKFDLRVIGLTLLIWGFIFS